VNRESVKNKSAANPSSSSEAAKVKKGVAAPQAVQTDTSDAIQRRLQEKLDRSPQSNRLKQIQLIANQSPQVNQLAAVQVMADQRPQATRPKIERHAEPRKTPLQAKAQGNRAPIQRDDFTFGGGSVEKTTINNQNDLNDEVETLIDDRYGGYRSLFTKNDVATSPSEWAALVFDYMSEEYNLVNLHRANFRAAINVVKDKYRDESLKHLVQTWIYGCKLAPYSEDNLKALMAQQLFIEDRDDDVIAALYETQGKFTKQKIDIGNGCRELSDANNRVVIIDSHQNKHHSPQIPELAAYGGGHGTRFAADKGLAWHRNNTAVVVDGTIETLVGDGTVTANGKVHCPAKDAIDGIIYDLSIQHDADTGKFVGSYHCNPVVSE